MILLYNFAFLCFYNSTFPFHLLAGLFAGAQSVNGQYVGPSAKRNQSTEQSARSRLAPLAPAPPTPPPPKKQIFLMNYNHLQKLCTSSYSDAQGVLCRRYKANPAEKEERRRNGRWAGHGASDLRECHPSQVLKWYWVKTYQKSGSLLCPIFTWTETSSSLAVQVFFHFGT